MGRLFLCVEFYVGNGPVMAVSRNVTLTLTLALTLKTNCDPAFQQ
jgi:hypothetical protein